MIEAAGDGRNLVALQLYAWHQYLSVWLIAAPSAHNKRNVRRISLSGNQHIIGDASILLAGIHGSIIYSLIFHCLCNIKGLPRKSLVFIQACRNIPGIIGIYIGRRYHKLRHDSVQGNTCRLLARSHGNILHGSEGIRSLGRGQYCRKTLAYFREHIIAHSPVSTPGIQQGRGGTSGGNHLQGVLAIIERKIRLGKVLGSARLVEHLQQGTRLLVVIEDKEIGKRLALCGEGCTGRGRRCLTALHRSGRNGKGREDGKLHVSLLFHGSLLAVIGVQHSIALGTGTESSTRCHHQ